MAFDGLVNYTISKELHNHILNGKIDKIFQPNGNEILLGIYNNGIKYALDIVISSNNYRICLTTNSKPNPTFAPNFCMVLRKYLLNTRITNIYTLSLERITVIEFEGHNKSGDFTTKKLIIELMGKHSNIILVNYDDIIIDALRHFNIDNHSYRNIVPNHQYILPLSSKLDFTKLSNYEDFYITTIQYLKENLSIEVIDDSLKLSEILSNIYTGISKNSILFAINELSIKDNVTKENMNKIYNYLWSIINNPYIQIVPFQDNNDYALSISPKKIDALQVNYFIDDYYFKKENIESFITYRDNLSKLILNYMKKLNNKLSNINNKLEECQNTDLYKLYGELITSNLYKISNEHLSEITIENYYDNNNLITIPLDKAVPPAINAKIYFKKYTKLKNTRQIVEIQKKEVEEEINYLESIIYEFQAATTISDIDNIYNEFSETFLASNKSSSERKFKNKKSPKNQSHIFANKIGEFLKYTIDGFTVLVGKNNKQNDFITKQANPDDLWFHAKDIHGSHVILKTENKNPSQETINKVASIAAFYSKATQSSNVPVDYTFIKYVKKPSHSKPGMVTYSNNKNVIVKPNKKIRPSIKCLALLDSLLYYFLAVENDSYIFVTFRFEYNLLYLFSDVRTISPSREFRQYMCRFFTCFRVAVNYTPCAGNSVVPKVLFQSSLCFRSC